MIALLAASILLLAICFLGLGIKVFFHRTHRFPETSAGHSPAMRARGIRCPRVEEGLLHGSPRCATCYGKARPTPKEPLTK